MPETNKTSQILTDENVLLKQRIEELKKARAKLKQTEEKLYRSEKIFASTFHINPDPMFIVDIVTEKIIDVNTAFTRWTGYSAQEVIGIMERELHLWANPEDRERFVDALKSKGEVNGAEIIMKQRNGHMCDVLVSVRLIELNEDHFYLILFHDITERKHVEKDREMLIIELQEALKKVKKLRGFLPICASCKKIRDDQGYWEQIEKYITEHSEAEFSHGICPECAQKLYPEFFKKTNK